MGQKQKGAAPKVGRGKRPGEAAKRSRWRETRGPEHRLKRIIIANGYEAARTWATTHGHVATLARLVRASTNTHVRQRLPAP